METLIVPTDFSHSSVNALEYALGLCRFTNSRIILLNAYHPFLPSGEHEGFAQDSLILQKESIMEKLNLLKKEMFQKNGGKFDIECIAEMGFSFDVIEGVAKRENADYIVMGITGEAGSFKKHMIGSTTIDVARNQPVPTFIIPEKVSYAPIKKISFACDFEKTEETSLMYQVKAIARLFSAELEIVNVDNLWDKISTEKAVTNYFVEHALENVKHETVHIVGSNVTQELENYYDSHQTDLIVLSPKKHNLFHQLFNYSITKELAFNSKLPILAIH
jgi:nucleotide-binding universal stress UspA family protein